MSVNRSPLTFVSEFQTAAAGETPVIVIKDGHPPTAMRNRTNKPRPQPPVVATGPDELNDLPRREVAGASRYTHERKIICSGVAINDAVRVTLSAGLNHELAAWT